MECIDEDYDEIFMNMAIDIIKKYIKLMLVNFDDIIYEFESKQKLINHLKKKANVLGAIYSNGKKQSKKNGWKYLWFKNELPYQ